MYANFIFFSSVVNIYIDICKVEFATVIKGNPKTLSSIATKVRCRGRHCSFPWITPFYP